MDALTKQWRRRGETNTLFLNPILPCGSSLSFARMSERISRILVGIEAVIFMLPLTLVMFIFLGPVVGMIAIGHQYPARDRALLTILFVLISALACGWRLVYAFLLYGVIGLKRQGAWVWVAPCLAIVVLLVAALVSRLMDFKSDNVLAAFHLFGNGGIAMIPFAHLVLERLLRANKSLEPTR